MNMVNIRRKVYRGMSDTKSQITNRRYVYSCIKADWISNWYESDLDILVYKNDYMCIHDS